MQGHWNVVAPTEVSVGGPALVAGAHLAPLPNALLKSRGARRGRLALEDRRRGVATAVPARANEIIIHEHDADHLVSVHNVTDHGCLILPQKVPVRDICGEKGGVSVV